MSAATIAEPRETGPRVPTASRRNLQILFYAGEHHLGGLLRDGDDGLASSLEVLGKPLSAYNVRKLNSRVGEVTRILLPNGLRRTVSILERELPFCQIEEYSDVGRFDEVENLVRLPLNSMVLEPEQGGYLVKRLVYPWDILEGMTELLRADVKETRVAESASVSKTCVLSGPCFISEGALVDDFAKVRGPAYIGEGSKVGTSSLIRESMVGAGCNIGFGCEVGRTYLAGNDRIAHHDVILDTVMGRDSWMGAFVGTTNVMFDNKNVRYRVGEGLIDTGRQHFGVMIGHDCAIGASVVILPGRFIPPGSVVPPGTVFSDGPTSRA